MNKVSFLNKAEQTYRWKKIIADQIISFAPAGIAIIIIINQKNKKCHIVSPKSDSVFTW